MKSLVLVLHRCRWVNLPVLSLIAFLQRSPVVARLVSAEQQISGSPVAALLKAAFTVSALGAYHAVAGATQLQSNPASPATVTAGQNASIAFAVTGAPAVAASYEITGSIPPGMSIPGLAGDLLNRSAVVLSGTPTTPGNYTMRVRAWNSPNKEGLGGNPTFNLVVNVQPGQAVAPPAITVQPVSQAATAGSNVVLAVGASGEALSYQWRKNGAAIPGATAPVLALNGIGVGDAAGYSVALTNAGGATTSATANLSIAAVAASKLRALSVRSSLGVNQRLIVGFSVVGGAKPLFVQATGPGLAAVGVAGALPDPRLEVYGGDAAKIAENDDWLDAVTATRAAVGAFNVGASRKDAALVSTVSGNATAHVFGPGSGLVLVEGYDTGAGDAQRLGAVSARNRVGTGADVLIVGLVVEGTTNRNVLVRAVGPRLTDLGLSGVLADPKIQVFNGNGTEIAENDNWPASLDAIIAATGLSFLPGSKDAALTLSLPPGAYTVQVSGVGGTTGEALADVYEQP